MTEPQSALLLRRQLAGNETVAVIDAGCRANDGTCGSDAVAVIETALLAQSVYLKLLH